MRHVSVHVFASLERPLGPSLYHMCFGIEDSFFFGGGSGGGDIVVVFEGSGKVCDCSKFLRLLTCCVAQYMRHLLIVFVV